MHRSLKLDPTGILASTLGARDTDTRIHVYSSALLRLLVASQEILSSKSLLDFLARYPGITHTFADPFSRMHMYGYRVPG
eukprot:1817624-Rhodomonas_salina.2